MEDLSLHILDIAENSASAGATEIRIGIDEDSATDVLRIGIQDNGRGISEEVLCKVRDPFYTTRTTRRVGLGLSLLGQATEETEGRMEIHSTEGQGTTVNATFRLSHIDRKPLGNIVDTVMVFIAGNPDIRLIFTYRNDRGSIGLDTQQIKEDLDGVPINACDVLALLRKRLRNEFDALQQQ